MLMEYWNLFFIIVINHEAKELLPEVNTHNRFSFSYIFVPNFQEYWCKRLHPKYVCERVFRQTPLCETLKKGRLRKQDFIITKHKSILLQAADLIGQKIQYNCPGFLSNRRQVMCQ